MTNTLEGIKRIRAELDAMEAELQKQAQDKAVDLSSCKAVDKLRRRDGEIVFYKGRRAPVGIFQHLAGGEIYRSNGLWSSGADTSDYDIVKVIVQ